MSEDQQDPAVQTFAAAPALTGVLVQTSPSAPTGAGPVTVDSSSEELLSRRSLTGPEVALVVAFLVVGAVLLLMGQPMLHIIGLLAGVGGIAVIVLARRLPRLSVR
ncbi:hypothetical protein CFP65_1992 [Kitasatospora sp. MMS16-BH015]|uniref:hypothetical protein n=1 Tax=Kitasatospora sp. MMS16-BH015 TaxID=2018025 RepID=UPI000CA2F567|nr:hypothetical protein [Kitasatospora sp. MMS16-BH015]AUG76857.1 hypothetical protein CFP65_1992 [Kitasatospora sp. MMS16-BH015]